VHRERSQVAVIDGEGKMLANRNVANGVEPTLDVIGGLPPVTPTAFEARSAGDGWVQLLEDHVFEPHLVHPLQCEAIASAPTLTIFCREGRRPPMTSSPIAAARSQYLLDLLAQVPDPRQRRGRRHALAGLLAVGIAAVIAGSRSFAAIGQWAADAGPEALAVLGATRGPAEESTFRRAFALASADALDRVLGAWLHTRAVRAGGRLVIAIDGKTVRGAKSKDGKAPHLVAALAHGIGAVLGQVAVEEKSNECVWPGGHPGEMKWSGGPPGAVAAGIVVR
jgi:DDE_Tnp_1-associated